jgi:Outer membrane protein beta-barrel domain
MTSNKSFQSLFVLFCLLLMASTSASAQKKFLKSGYYVRPGGDTLFGYFVYKGWKQNPREIEFYKSTSLKEPATFYPREGSSFSIKLDKNARETYVAYNINGYGETDSIFLKQVYKGRVSIYKWKDEQSSERFFIRKENGKIEELTEDNAFSTQLEGYMKDCPFVPEVIEIGYNEKELVELAKIYNRCKGVKLAKKKHEPFKLEGGMMGAFGNTELSVMQGEKRVKLPESSIRPAFGFVANLVIPNTKQRLSLHESAYTQSFRCIYARELPDSQPSNKHIIEKTYDFSYLKIGTSLQYQFRDRTMMPYIRSGVSYGIALKGESKSDNIYQNGGTTDSVKPSPDADKLHEWGWISAFGMQYEHLQMEARLEIGDGVSTSPTLKMQTRTIMVGVNYVF